MTAAAVPGQASAQEANAGESSALNPKGAHRELSAWWAPASTFAFIFKKQSGHTLNQKTCKKLEVVKK